MTINRIGPLVVSQMIEPSTIDPIGGAIQTTVADRRIAEQIEELINNPYRVQEYGGVSGVLEYIGATGASARYGGWWILSSCGFSYTRRQFRASDPAKSYIPLQITGRYIGAGGAPAIAATHRSLTNDFGLAAQPITAALYPGNALDLSTPAPFFRFGASGNGTYCYKTAAKRAGVRYRDQAFFGVTFDPAKTTLRPTLRDPQGYAHYGPHSVLEAEGFRLENDYLRVTIGSTPLEKWLVEAWTGAAWTTLGAVSLTIVAGAAAHYYRFSDVRVLDDRVSVTLIDDLTGGILNAEIRAGELGMRVQSNVPRYIQWFTSADGAAGTAIKAANYYQDDANEGWGGRRFIAIRRNVLAESLADWQIVVDANHPAMIGFIPNAAQADDAVAEQGKQFLSDRVQTLVLE